MATSRCARRLSSVNGVLMSTGDPIGTGTSHRFLILSTRAPTLGAYKLCRFDSCQSQRIVAKRHWH